MLLLLDVCRYHGRHHSAEESACLRTNAPGSEDVAPLLGAVSALGDASGRRWAAMRPEELDGAGAALFLLSKIFRANQPPQSGVALVWPERSDLDALVAVLRRHASQCSWRALDAAAVLPDQTISVPYFDLEQDLPGFRHETYDCSEARSLATEELQRRIAIGEVPPELPTLLERVLDPYPLEDRMIPARLLARSGDAGAVEPLAQALQSSDPEIRQAAAVALSGIADGRALHSVLAAMEYPYFLGGPSIEKILERIAAMGSDVDALLRSLATAEGSSRQRVVRLLGESHDARATEPLVSLLRTATADGDQKTVERVAEALVAVGSVAVERLTDMLRDADPYLRWSSASILGKIGDPRAISALRPLLNDQDEGVREAADVALERIQARP